jgi:signal transduction histidine kinase
MGQRQEVQILLPSALLIMAVLSTFALFAYRNTVQLLVETRQAEAMRMGRQLASEMARGPLPSRGALRQGLPVASAVTVFNDKKETVVSFGSRAMGPSGLMTADGASRGWFFGALLGGGDVISSQVLFDRGGRHFSLQVDLPSPVLRSRQRGLRILTPVVLLVNGAITVWVLFFLRRLMVPFDRLVEQARSAGQEMTGSQDEVAFLAETFEKALEALSHREIDELEALQGTLGRSLKSGVLLCDAKGHVQALNEMGADVLQVGGFEVGSPLNEAFGRQSEFVVLLEKAVRKGETVQREECKIATAEGERTLGITAHPLRREDGSVRGFLVLFADLTQAKEELREKHLVESLAQLGELTAGVAHELRNSLATMRGYLGLMERDPEDEQSAEYLVEMRRESDHLARVLEDFLTFARPGSARGEEVDLAGLAHRAAVDPALDGAEVVVRSTVSGEELVVWGDAQLLERALRNVLSNAVEAQAETGVQEPIEIILTVRQGGTEVAILDRGPGVAPEIRERLFDPFFTSRSGGVGLGLALTRRIVLLHAGSISLEPRAHGGTRAEIWLPVGKSVTESNKRRKANIIV